LTRSSGRSATSSNEWQTPIFSYGLGGPHPRQERKYDALSGEGRGYGGGLPKLEPKELANVDATAIADLIPGLRPPTAIKQMDIFEEAKKRGPEFFLDPSSAFSEASFRFYLPQKSGRPFFP